MRLKTAALATAVSFALTVLPAAAQGFGRPHHGPDADRPGPILHMARELGLSDAQKAQVKAITAGYMGGSLGDMREAMHTARETLRRTIHDTAASDQKVREAAAAVAALESQAAVERHRMFGEISGVLTAEQRTKLEELAGDREGRRPDPPRRGPRGR